MPPAVTISGVKGGAVTVDRGGFGNDNVIGKVTNSPPPGRTMGSGRAGGVWGAKVWVTNLSNGQKAQTKTGIFGDYDVDVDASAGDRIQIRVEFFGSSGYYVVTNTGPFAGTPSTAVSLP